MIDVEITDELKKPEEGKTEEVKKEAKVIEFEDPFAYDDEPPKKAVKPQTPPPTEEKVNQMIENGEELMKSETCPPGVDVNIAAGMSLDVNKEGEVKKEVEVQDAFVDEIPTKTQTPPPQEDTDNASTTQEEKVESSSQEPPLVPAAVRPFPPPP